MLDVAHEQARTKSSPAARALDAQAVERQRIETWIDTALREAQYEIITVTTTLTPALAKALLARNPDNRSPSAEIIERYARDIRGNAWSFNGQTIVVSRDGFLNDGQHRCLAVLESGRSIRTVIVFGPERETRFTLDQGRVRTTGDYLAMKGHLDAVSHAAVASYIWQHRTHGRLSAQQHFRPTKAEVLAVVENFRDIALSMAAVPSKGANSVGGRSLCAFCHWTFARRAGQEDATAFIKALAEGNDLSAGDPILYARNRLGQERGRLRANEKAELIFRAWNAHRRRQKPKTLTIADGPLPAVEG